jgi:cell division protein FtsQ
VSVTRVKGSRAGARTVAEIRGQIDPRIRARRAAVLRDEARRRLRTALWLLGLVVVVAGGWFVLHSRLFAARVVTVVGATHTPVSRIVAAAGLADHPPLIDVGGAAAAGIERLPWVERATVSRQWPDGVRIVVKEWAPAATVQEVAGSGWAVVNRHGKVLAADAQPPSNLPRVVAPVPPGSPGSTVHDVRAALAVASSLPKAFADQVTRIAEDRAGEVTLQLSSGLDVYLGSTSQLAQKYEDVAAILKGAVLSAGSTIDVAAPATPVVRP